MAKTSGKRVLPTPGQAARSAGRRIAPPPRRPFGAMDAVLLFAGGGLLLLIFFSAALPRFLGYTPYAISSDSMAPTLHRGDLLFAAPLGETGVTAGDIVVFRTETGLITHRVYSVNEAEKTLLTKADASLYLDPAPVGEAQLLGRAVYKLPLVGYVSLLWGGREGTT